MQEESFQSGSDSEEEEGEDDEEEEEREPEIEIKKISADSHRRGKSVHHTSSRPATTSSANVAQQKKGLKNKLKSAFKNFF